MAAPRKVDYDRIEPAWRAGIKSPAQLAAEYTAETKVSVSHAAIIKHFKKLGVPRDLSAKVRAKADAMVMESMVTSKVASITKARESEIVSEAAEQQVHVRLAHRTDIRRARKLCIALLAELEVASEERMTVEELADALYQLEAAANPTAAHKAREALSRAISIPARTGALKALTDSLKTLVGLERQAWGLAEGSAPDPEVPADSFTADQSEAAYARMRG